MARVQVKFTLPSLTKQSFKDECDINRIIDRFTKGDVSSISCRNGSYGDVSEPFDLQVAYDMIMRAEQAYDRLPPKVKERCGSASSFMAWVSNPANKSECEALGLCKEVLKPVVSTPQT